MSRTFLFLSLVLGLSACTWDTYQGEDGKMHVKQRYPNGTGVYYTNGASSQNTHYHNGRPEQHVILPSDEE